MLCPISAVPYVRSSYVRRKQIFHLFLAVSVCSNWGGKVFVMTDNSLWQELYAAAMVELDRVQLQNRIDAAQIAIRQIMQELTGQCAVGVAEELEALSSALGNLQALQRVEFRKPISSGSEDLNGGGLTL
jgi:hypothetical protein